MRTSVVPIRVVAGDVEQRLGDRQRGAQLVGRVGGEPLLLGELGLEPGEHRVEGVGELAELVAAAREPDPMGQRSARRPARGVGDPGQRGEHASGEQPPAHEPEQEQERQHGRCPRRERLLEVGAVGHEPAEAR